MKYILTLVAAAFTFTACSTTECGTCPMSKTKAKTSDSCCAKKSDTCCATKPAKKR